MVRVWSHVSIVELCDHHENLKRQRLFSATYYIGVLSCQTPFHFLDTIKFCHDIRQSLTLLIPSA